MNNTSTLKPSLRTTTDFFGKEYVNFASYDNIRKIASLVDGQKNASRKVLWFTLKKNLKKELKVSQLDSKAAEFTEYLHGGMAGVIVTLAKDYPGTNNMNLMYPEGNFGNRIINDASAARYIYTYGTPELFEQINQEDEEILEHQYFEGHRIEPKFLLPSLPLLLVNGSEGISSGFAQKILPRNPKEIEKYIKYYLKNPDAPKKPFKNLPYFRGFKGTVKEGDTPQQIIIEGVFQRTSNTKIKITELPIGYNLKSYLKVLDKLEDDGKIQTYKDLSNKSFEIDVTFKRETLKMTDEKLIEYLKLQKRVSENWTVMSEENIVIPYECANDIMQHYMRVKMSYLQKRKEHSIISISQNIRELVSKYVFIKKIVDNELVINKRPLQDIEDDLRSIERIIPIDQSYDYLLNMGIRSLTKERMEKLLKEVQTKKATLDKLKKQTLEEIWMDDLA